VARILVADDNSNIQKMVGLALKDQGIDVVAVGNGEAAVRKISDIRPDLVLADVFMPVRNGYEVCQYVKSDTTLAHIPVILLVGAFDPLDEQEAQRVGADGVLKKPFVPPDPLISMVKSALARAGVSIGGAPPPPQVQEEPIRVAEMLTPRPTASSRALPSASTMAPVQEFPSIESEPVQEEAAALPPPVKIDAGSQPLAFGSFLESPVAEPEDDIAFAATARPELERDWKSGDKEDEVEEEEDEKHGASWRRDGAEMEEEEKAAAPVKDWRETAFAEAPARKMRNDSWAPQKEISGFEEAAETEQSVSAMVSDAPVTEIRRGPAPIAPFSEEAWVAALNPRSTATMDPAPASIELPALPVPPPVVEQKEVAPAAHVETPVHAEAAVSTPAPEKVEAAPAPEPEKSSTGTSWFSAVSSPWDAEVQKANRLASTWDAPAVSVPSAAPSAAAPVEAEVGKEAAPERIVYAHTDELIREDIVEEVPAATAYAASPVLTEDAKAEEAALPAATVEAIREEAQHVAETSGQAVSSVDATTKAAEPSMEDLVAKVLAKMNPDMLQAVTRDILKNVVESMVRDELNSKKQ
jgi:CheY-like chemotaxis protein